MTPAKEILIVDDEAGVRSALSGVLRDEGYEVETVESGEACLDRVGRAPYDVIVLTGSTPVLPTALLEQLAPGGRLFAVVGDAPAMAARLVVT